MKTLPAACWLLLLLHGVPRCLGDACCWTERPELAGAYGFETYDCPANHDIQNVSAGPCLRVPFWAIPFRNPRLHKDH